MNSLHSSHTAAPAATLHKPWPSTATRRVLVYAVAGVFYALIISWWFRNSALPANTQPLILVAIGRLLGLTAAYGALMQLVLMSRLPIIERSLGFEELITVHRWNGYIIFYSLVAHPIFLAFGYLINGQPGFVRQYLTFITQFPDVLKAFIGSLLFTAVAIFSASIVRRRLRYEWWYAVHLSVYLAILLIFGHQLSNGGDFVGHPLFRYYWTALYITAFSIIGLYRFIVPVISWLEHRTTVDRIVREAEGIYSLYVSGRKLDRIDVEPGQFFNLRIFTRQLWYEAHPFSISRLPDEKSLRFTFKVSGDFTAKLVDVPKGAMVLLDGPRGNFTWQRLKSTKALLVAGGIGITPLRALLDAIPVGVDVVLLYSCRISSEVAFRDELKSFAGRPNVTIHIVISDQEGRLSQVLIEKYCPDYVQREAFICGPDGLVVSVGNILLEHGVQRHAIYSERFVTITPPRPQSPA